MEDLSIAHPEERVPMEPGNFSEYSPRPTGRRPSYGRSLQGCHVEDVVGPRRHVEVEASREELAAVAVVARGAHHVCEPHHASRVIREWKAHVALALVVGIVHDDEPPIFAVLPRPDDEAIPGVVAPPRRSAFQELPLAVPDRGVV